MMPSTNTTFQMMETEIDMFESGSSRLMVAKSHLNKKSRQENSIHRIPNMLKSIQVSKNRHRVAFEANHIGINRTTYRNLIVSKIKFNFSKAKNGNKVIERSLLPCAQIHFEVIELKVWLIFIELDFASSFILFCEVKISVYDHFCFGKKNISTFFRFSSAEILFPG